MTDRQWVLDTVAEMPEDFSAPEILEDLSLQTTLRRRIAQGNATVANDAVPGLIDEWIAKSSGKTKPSTT